MFVLATIASLTAFGSVKVRNMSLSGALIEGAALPAIDEVVYLSRGANTVQGRVAWSTGGRAGIHFDGRVEVSEWTPGGNRRQDKVNLLVRQVKAGAIPLGAAELDPPDGLAPSDLAKLARAIDRLADTLADDPVIVRRFGAQLQTLDIASQVLGKLSKRTG